MQITRKYPKSMLFWKRNLYTNTNFYSNLVMWFGWSMALKHKDQVVFNSAFRQFCYKSQLNLSIKTLLMKKAVHRNLVLSVSFCMRKVDFPHLRAMNSAEKTTFRTQNDTDSTNFRYTANKKYSSYYVLLR